MDKPQYHVELDFWYSEAEKDNRVKIAEIDRDFAVGLPRYAIIDGRRVEYTHCGLEELGHSVIYSDEVYLGKGVMV